MSQSNTYSLAESVAVLANEVKNLKDRQLTFVSKESFGPVRTLVYGMAAIILTGVIGALINLVLLKR